ncbi:hypothetical protein CVT24_004884 [Panaeolus cyanescens]|uniref:RhoGAP-domain-containing protein n=1 Tax=Panaeolus cyanescens TaxID=181874 RepID=A0A409W227_9AGAR|nr:hypothetical protein CVT24_004884 [Panaeolus cyanescens]
MALNSANLASSGGLTVHATPTRERDRHPFPQSSQPSPAPSLRQTTSSVASSSVTSLPSTASSSTHGSAHTQALTVDGLLKQNASAADQKLAALEQAVNDRNVLSAQNTQLWKLIEKQRAGYNQILKELERIRGERDSYKSKLATLTGSSSISSDSRSKSSTSGDRTARPSLDSSISQSSSLSQTPHQPRQSNPRHNSEDSGKLLFSSQRNGHHLHSSRSHEPLSARLNDNGLQSNALYNFATNNTNTSTPGPPPSSAPAASPHPPTRQQRPSPSPLVVPVRSDTHSNIPSAVTNSPDSSIFPRQSLSGDATTIAPNNNAANSIYNSPSSTRPLAHPRKSSLADSLSSVATSGSNSSSLPSSTVSISSNLSANNFGGNTPTVNTYSSSQNGPTAPSNNSPLSVDNPFSRQRTTSSIPSGGNGQPQQPGMLSPLGDSRPHHLSRDSRISLPDEAKQYMLNMPESPAASPRVDTFSPKSKLSNAIYPPQVDGSRRTDDFLDLEADDDESEEEEAGDVTAGADDPAFNGVRQRIQGGQGHEHNTNDQYGHQSSHPSQRVNQNNYSSLSDSSRDDLSAMQTRRKDKSRVAPEEFPLPPPSNIYVQRQQPLPSDGPAYYYSQNSPHASSAQQPSPAAPPMSSKQSQSSADQSPHGSTSGGPQHQGSHPELQSSQKQESRQSSQSQQQGQGSQPVQAVPASFRALPLLSSDLPHTTITVSHSFVRPNDRGKEVLSFIVFVNPGNGKDGWKVEKMYSDVLSLDQRVRSTVGKGVGKKIANLPEGKLWKDHAPAKVDQRKAVLENYLQTLIQLPVKNNDEVIAFFTSDIVREQKQPVMQVGHKEGYLTKRGKNFGGWKTRFFVLQGPVLEYYDCRGGAHLGSITITGAQIARQHRTEKPPTTDDEKEYRHAFLIVEAKKGPGGSHPRHVLCAESDEDRDSWVEMLVRYYTGTYSEDLVFNPSSGLTSVQSNSIATASQGSIPPRSSTSSEAPTPTSRTRPPGRGMSRDDIAIGPAVPISQLSLDANNAKLFQPVPGAEDYLRSSSPSKSLEPSPIDRQGPSAAASDPSKKSDLGLPSSLPDSSPLSSAQAFRQEIIGNASNQRANSELGHYPDLNEGRPRGHRQVSPERHRARDDSRKPFHPSLNTVSPSPTTTAPPPERAPSPEKLDASGKVKISGPMNGAPIPSGFKFGGKDAATPDSTTSANDRREKAKSRSFWNFGKANGDKSQVPVPHTPRAVFGVPLEDSLEVAQKCNLPAIVFRAIEYLEAKKADQEEGIYRLSGSSAVIKSLKDRFNNEGDVDLLASDEYWDPHAIAGLLKSYLRELPSSILTRDLHLRFLAVIDFVDPQERIRELSQLIAALPLANYSLLRALTAHLILIVQNSNVNKMTMRNVGIVFSPTLGIPAGVFSLMLGEFNRVFNVDAGQDGGGEQLLDNPSEPLRRNSRQYSDTAADQLLGLAGRSLSTPAEETHSDADGDDFSLQYESGTETTEGEVTVESASSSPVPGIGLGQSDRKAIRVTPPDTPTASKISKASNTAASRGLNVTVTTSERGNRHSRLMGLPSSPRPNNTQSPSQTTTAGEPFTLTLS